MTSKTNCGDDSATAGCLDKVLTSVEKEDSNIKEDNSIIILDCFSNKLLSNIEEKKHHHVRGNDMSKTGCSSDKESGNKDKEKFDTVPITDYFRNKDLGTREKDDHKKGNILHTDYNRHANEAVINMEKDTKYKEDGELSNHSDSEVDFIVLSDSPENSLTLSDISSPESVSQSKNTTIFTNTKQHIQSQKLSELELRKKNLIEQLTTKLNNKEDIENFERIIMKSKHKKDKKHKEKKKSKKNKSKNSKVKCVAEQELTGHVEGSSLSKPLALIEVNEDADKLFPNLTEVRSVKGPLPNDISITVKRSVTKVIIPDTDIFDYQHTSSKSPSPKSSFRSVHKTSDSREKSPIQIHQDKSRKYHPKVRKVIRKKSYHLRERSLSPKNRYLSRDNRLSPKKSHYPRDRSLSPKEGLYNRDRSLSPKEIYCPSDRSLSPKKIYYPRYGSISPKKIYYPRDGSLSPRKSSRDKSPSSKKSYSPEGRSSRSRRRQSILERSSSPSCSKMSLSGSIPFSCRNRDRYSSDSKASKRRKKRNRKQSLVSSSSSRSSSGSSTQSDGFNNFLTKCTVINKKVIDISSWKISDIGASSAADPLSSSLYDPSASTNHVPVPIPSLEYASSSDVQVISLSDLSDPSKININHSAKYNLDKSIVPRSFQYFSSEQVVPCQNQSSLPVSFTTPATLNANEFNNRSQSQSVIPNQTDNIEYSYDNVSNYDAMSMESVSMLSFDEGDGDIWKDNIPTQSNHNEPTGNHFCSTGGDASLINEMVINDEQTKNNPKTISILNTNRLVKKNTSAQAVRNCRNLIEPKICKSLSNESSETSINLTNRGNREVILDAIESEFILRNTSDPNFLADGSAKFFSELQHVLCKAVYNPNYLATNSDVLHMEKWFAIINSIYQDLIHKKNETTLVKVIKYLHLLELLIDYFNYCITKPEIRNIYSDQFPRYITRLEVLKCFLKQQGKQNPPDEQLATFVRKHTVQIKEFLYKKHFSIEFKIASRQTKTLGVPNNAKVLNIDLLTNKIDRMCKLIDGPNCYEMFEKISMESLKYFIKRVSCDLQKTEAHVYTQKCQKLIHKKIQLSKWKGFIEKLHKKANDKNSISLTEINQLIDLNNRFSTWNETSPLLKQIKEIFELYRSQHPTKSTDPTNDKSGISKTVKEIKSMDSNTSLDPAVNSKTVQKSELGVVDSNINNNALSHVLDNGKVITNEKVTEFYINALNLKINTVEQSLNVKKLGSNTTQPNETNHTPPQVNNIESCGSRTKESTSTTVTDQCKDNHRRTSIEGDGYLTIKTDHSSATLTDQCKDNHIRSSSESNGSQTIETAHSLTIVNDQCKDNLMEIRIITDGSRAIEMAHSSSVASDQCKQNQITSFESDSSQSQFTLDSVPAEVYTAIDYQLMKNFLNNAKLNSSMSNVDWGNKVNCVINTNQSFLGNNTCKDTSQLHFNHVKACISKEPNALQKRSNKDHSLQEVKSDLENPMCKKNDTLCQPKILHNRGSKPALDKVKLYPDKYFLKSENSAPAVRNVNPILLKNQKTCMTGFQIDESIEFKLRDYKVQIPYVRYREQLSTSFNALDPRLCQDKKRLEEINNKTETLDSQIVEKSENVNKPLPSKIDMKEKIIRRVSTSAENNMISKDPTISKINPKDPRLQKCTEPIKEQNAVINNQKSVEHILCKDSAWSRIPFRSSQEEPQINKRMSSTGTSITNQKTGLECLNGHKNSTESPDVVENFTSDLVSQLSKNLFCCENTKSDNDKNTDVQISNVSEPYPTDNENEVNHGLDNTESCGLENFNTENKKLIKNETNKIGSNLEPSNKKNLAVNATTKDLAEHANTNVNILCKESAWSRIPFRSSREETSIVKRVSSAGLSVTNSKSKCSDGHKSATESSDVKIFNSNHASQLSKNLICFENPKSKIDENINVKTSDVSKSFPINNKNEVKRLHEITASSGLENKNLIKYETNKIGSNLEPSNEKTFAVNATKDLVVEKPNTNVKIKLNNKLERDEKLGKHPSAQTRETTLCKKNIYIKKSENHKKFNNEKISNKIENIFKTNEECNDVKNIKVQTKKSSNVKANYQCIDIFKEKPSSKNNNKAASVARVKNNIDIGHQEGFKPKLNQKSTNRKIYMGSEKKSRSCLPENIVPLLKNTSTLNSMSDMNRDTSTITGHVEAAPESGIESNRGKLCLGMKEIDNEKSFLKDSKCTNVKRLFMETPYLKAFRNDVKLFECFVLIEANSREGTSEKHTLKRNFEKLIDKRSNSLENGQVLSKKKRTATDINNTSSKPYLQIEGTYNSTKTTEPAKHSKTTKVCSVDKRYSGKVSSTDIDSGKKVCVTGRINTMKLYSKETNNEKNISLIETNNKKKDVLNETDNEENVKSKETNKRTKVLFSRTNIGKKVCSEECTHEKKKCSTHTKIEKKLCSNIMKKECSTDTYNENNEFSVETNSSRDTNNEKKVCSPDTDKKKNKCSAKTNSSTDTNNGKKACSVETCDEKNKCSAETATSRGTNNGNKLCSAQTNSSTDTYNEKNVSSAETNSSTDTNNEKKVCTAETCDEKNKFSAETTTSRDTNNGKKLCSAETNSSTDTKNEKNVSSAETNSSTDTNNEKNVCFAETNSSRDTNNEKKVFSAETNSSTDTNNEKKVCSTETNSSRDTNNAKKACSTETYDEKISCSTKTNSSIETNNEKKVCLTKTCDGRKECSAETDIVKDESSAGTYTINKVYSMEITEGKRFNDSKKVCGTENTFTAECINENKVCATETKNKKVLHIIENITKNVCDTQTHHKKCCLDNNTENEVCSIETNTTDKVCGSKELFAVDNNYKKCTFETNNIEKSCSVETLNLKNACCTEGHCSKKMFAMQSKIVGNLHDPEITTKNEIRKEVPPLDIDNKKLVWSVKTNSSEFSCSTKIEDKMNICSNSSNASTVENSIISSKNTDLYSDSKKVKDGTTNKEGLQDPKLDISKNSVLKESFTRETPKLDVKDVWDRMKRHVVNSKVPSISKPLPRTSSDNEPLTEPMSYILRNCVSNTAPESSIEKQSDNSIPKVIIRRKRFSLDCSKRNSNKQKPPIKVNLRRSSEDTWVHIKDKVPDVIKTIPHEGDKAHASPMLYAERSIIENNKHGQKKNEHSEDQNISETPTRSQQQNPGDENNSDPLCPQPYQRKALSEIYSCSSESLDHYLEEKDWEDVDCSSSVAISFKSKPSPKSRKRKSILVDNHITKKVRNTDHDDSNSNNSVEAHDESIIKNPVGDSNDPEKISFSNLPDQDAQSSTIYTSKINSKKITHKKSKSGKFNIENFIKEKESTKKKVL